jgi:P27 family predicted phage terminase small subunit
MPRGRKPTKNTLANLEGCPVKPLTLDPVASQEWDRLCLLLEKTGNLSVVDGGALELYCCAYSKFVECEKRIAKEGLTTVANNGLIVASPHFNIQKQCEATMLKLQVQFGLSPRARAQVKQQEKKKDDAAKKWSGILFDNQTTS